VSSHGSERARRTVRNAVNDVFRFALEGSDDEPVLVFKGNLDHSADPAVLELLRSVVGTLPAGRWTVDASRVAFADSTAIQVLVDLGRIIDPASQLRVVAKPSLTRLIDLVCPPGRLTVEADALA
jgi:anti-anti-sigma regulatory factor